MPKPTGSYFGEYTGRRLRGRSYQATGEFRAPKQGEYYLSGAIVTAYRAAQDLSTAYWIAVDTDAPSWEKYPAKEWALALQGLTPGGSEFLTPAECVAHAQKKMGRDWPSIIVRLRDQNKDMREILQGILHWLELEDVDMLWDKHGYCAHARKVLNENKED